MFKLILSKIFSSRIFYILFSLLVAVALWMYVEITEHDVQRIQVPGIEIVYRNMDLLRDRGFLISSRDPQTVTIDFETSRAIGIELNRPGAVTVEIDLGNITKTGPAYLVYDIIYPAGIDRNAVNPVVRSVNRVSIIVDRLWRVSVPVEVDYRGGTASEDLVAETEVYDPRTITVEGPEEILSMIAKAVVQIPRQDLSSSITEEFSYILVDETGEELHESLLEDLIFSHDAILVTIPIRQIKNIQLYVELHHAAGTSESNTNVTITPEFITVSGDPEAIRDFNSLLLGPVDMSKFLRSNTYAFPIILSDTFTRVSGETEALVLVETVGLGIRYFVTQNLQIINTPPGLAPTIRTLALDVRIRGTDADLELISVENIRVVADIRDANPGTSTIPARVYVDGVDADVGAVGEYQLMVTLEREQP